VTATDGGTATVAVTGLNVDPVAPTATMIQPVTPYTTSRSITAAWVAADALSGVKVSTLRWTRRPASGGSWSEWTTPTTWTNLTTRSLSITANLGYQYCLAARATDTAGNLSAWSPSRCISAPYDDRALSASASWRQRTATGWLGGTYTETDTHGASLTSAQRFTVHQVGIIATRCPSCGAVDIFIGATKVGTINLYAPTTQSRELLLLPRSTTASTGDVRLVRSRWRLVRIDALAATP